MRKKAVPGKLGAVLLYPLPTWTRRLVVWTGLAFERVCLLLDRNDRVIALCEMKFADDVYTLTRKDFESMKHKRAAFRLATGTRRAVHLTVVTTDGLVHNSYRHEIQKELTLNDLFVSLKKT